MINSESGGSGEGSAFEPELKENSLVQCDTCIILDPKHWNNSGLNVLAAPEGLLRYLRWWSVGVE